MHRVETVHHGANRLGENPVWSSREACLYWVDSRAPAVFRLGIDGTVESRALPQIVRSIGLRRSGGLIVALQNGLHGFDFDSATLSFIADPEPDQPENPSMTGGATGAGGSGLAR